MNAERLHAIAKALIDDFESTNAVTYVQQLQSSLQNQVNAPQEPSYQQQVASSLENIYTTLASSSANDFPPIWRQTAEAIGAEGLLGSDLADSFRLIFERNQITPSVALSEVTEIATRLSAFEQRLRQLTESLEFLNVGSEELESGEAEVGVLIPRPSVHEDLAELGQEFVKLQKVLAPFQELVTGSRPPMKVSSISSTDFGVFLDIDPKTAACIAVAVERVVAFYKQILERRGPDIDVVSNAIANRIDNGFANYAKVSRMVSQSSVCRKPRTAMTSSRSRRIDHGSRRADRVARPSDCVNRAGQLEL